MTWLETSQTGILASRPIWHKQFVFSRDIDSLFYLFLEIM